MLNICLLSIAGLAIGLSQIVNKKLSYKKHLSSSFTATLGLTNALISILLLFINFYISKSIYIWFLILISASVYALSTYFSFKAYKLTDISSVAIIQRLNVVFVALFGIFFLGEHYTFKSYFGLILIFFGGLLVVIKRYKVDFNMGIFFAVLMAFSGAVAAVLDKVVLADFSPYTYVFFNNFIIGLVFLPRKGLIKDSLTLFRENKSQLFLTAFLASFSYLLVLIVLKNNNVSKIIPIYKSLSLITPVLIGISVLNEKDRKLQKIIGSVISIIGMFFLVK